MRIYPGWLAGLLLTTLFLAGRVIAADLAGFAPAIKEGAMKWGLAAQKLNDVDTYEKYTYPGIHTLNGGLEASKQAYIDARPRMEEEMARNAYVEGVFPQIVIGEPYNFLEVKGVYYVLVPVEYRDEAADGWDITSSTFIAISKDQGKNWFYFNPVNLENDAMFYKVLPDLKDKMPRPREGENKFQPKPGQPQYGT